MKKSVIIGSLIAGAFLLPATASAGVVGGRCDNCHTMHASQGGVTTTKNATLLKGSGCAACHAISFTNTTQGIGGGYNAPQVIATSNTLSGGRFDLTSDNQHNVLDYGAADSVFGEPLTVTPGGNPQTAQIECVTCHTGSGTHHGTTGPYRMITGLSGTGSLVYGAVVGRSDNTYDAASMNTFCSTCHGLFHGTGSGDTNLGTYGGWLRHPVNISLADADTATSRGYVADYAGAGAPGEDESPLGVGSVLMCLSCHYAHGSAQADMLAWTYSVMDAGDNARNGGCENCHTYGATGY